MNKKGGILSALIFGIVGFAILYYLKEIQYEGMISASLSYMVIILFLIWIFSAIFKRFIGDPRPLEEAPGMPSAHSAIAFAMLPIVGVNHASVLAASLIGIWRIAAKKHTFIQVLGGAAFGYTLSVFMFSPWL